MKIQIKLEDRVRALCHMRFNGKLKETPNGLPYNQMKEHGIMINYRMIHPTITE